MSVPAREFLQPHKSELTGVWGDRNCPSRANLNNSLATCDTGCVSLIVVVLYIETIYYAGLDVSRLSKID